MVNFQDEKEKAFAVAESESQALTRKLILEQDELEVRRSCCPGETALPTIDLLMDSVAVLAHSIEASLTPSCNMECLS